MGTVRFVPMHQVAPGDVAFDRARSTYGRLVELTTREEVAHCFVYHRRLGVEPDGRHRWLIAEMSALHGATFAERVEAPLAIVRAWRLPSEQSRLLEASRRIIREGARYDWIEIGRILLKLTAGRTLGRGETDRTICVAHVLRAILAARPDLTHHLPSPGEPVWPGRMLDLLQDLQVERVLPSINGHVPHPTGLDSAGTAA